MSERKWWQPLVMLVITVVIVGGLVSLFNYLEFIQVQAAPVSPPEVSKCVVIAETVAHTISRCEDKELGNIFYMNNLGLPMVPWEE